MYNTGTRCILYNVYCIMYSIKYIVNILTNSKNQKIGYAIGSIV